jgi:hypothetical protein
MGDRVAGDLISANDHAQVEAGELVEPEPLTRALIWEDNHEYLQALGGVIGPQAAERALEAYLRRIETAGAEIAAQVGPPQTVRVRRH